MNPLQSLAGALVGFTVGLTGMGGGALMTPMMVLLFGVSPGTAVSSDLLTSLVMKPVGGTVHYRRGTIDWPLVRWLAAGSVPAAFSGVFVLHQLGSGAAVQHHIKTLLGWALIVAAVSMVAKAWMSVHGSRQPAPSAGAPAVKRVATLLIGVAGGFIVGMTSVGSGSLMIVMLLLLYPTLSTKRLVGTDLVQAIPLVAAATLSHVFFGHIDIGLTGSLLVGSVPGVYLGARASTRAPDALIRAALIVILLGSALKLLDLGTATVGWTLLLGSVVALPIWGATDASIQPDHVWPESGRRRTTWVTAQAVAAPFGLGALVAVWYFAAVRPRLAARDQKASFAPALGHSPAISLPVPEQVQ